MIRATAAVAAASLLTLASVLYVRTGDERALYGHEDPLEGYYQPRELAGWPAPYLVDDPDTSVRHQIGIEDTLRPANLVASFAFWQLLVVVVARLVRRKG